MTDKCFKVMSKLETLCHLKNRLLLKQINEDYIVKENRLFDCFYLGIRDEHGTLEILVFEKVLFD